MSFVSINQPAKVVIFVETAKLHAKMHITTLKRKAAKGNKKSTASH